MSGFASVNGWKKLAINHQRPSDSGAYREVTDNSIGFSRTKDCFSQRSQFRVIGKLNRAPKLLRESFNNTPLVPPRQMRNNEGKLGLVIDGSRDSDDDLRRLLSYQDLFDRCCKKGNSLLKVLL